MRFRPCPRCKKLIPANEWLKHQTMHRNAENANTAHRSYQWQKDRTAVRKRDGYRCVVCGITLETLREQGKQLHVHHLNEDPTDNRMENLESRCEDCHQRGGVPKKYRRR